MPPFDINLNEEPPESDDLYPINWDDIVEYDGPAHQLDYDMVWDDGTQAFGDQGDEVDADGVQLPEPDGGAADGVQASVNGAGNGDHMAAADENEGSGQARIKAKPSCQSPSVQAIAATRTAMPQPHVVVVPYPGSGNINPALQLAQALRHHGVFVTFVVTEHNLRRAQAATEGAVSGREGFRIETIPDGLVDADRDQQDYDLAVSKATTHRCAAPLRELVARLRGGGGAATPDVPPVTCVLPTALMSFALEVAQELGVPSMVFWTMSAAALMGHMRLRQLRERGYLPLKDDSCLTNGYLETTIIDWIPGMPPINLGDVSSFVRTTDPNDFGLWFNDTESNNCTKAGALIINTFDALEPDVLAALRAEYPRTYTVGPLGSLLRRHHDDEDAAGGSSLDLSLWKHDTECLAWLDAQAPGSVVYANFGSLTVVTAAQLEEFAWGLAATGRPFLWVIREDLVAGVLSGPAAALPPAFAAETAARGRVATWCPQEQVLRHRAVGCFLTHNGWNSTCECLAAGVPMVCWPVFADQFTISKYACEVWGVGRRLDAEVRREQVAARVGEVMESVEVRRSAARWKAVAEEAAGAGGSSHENLLAVVEALGVSSLNSKSSEA